MVGKIKVAKSVKKRVVRVTTDPKVTAAIWTAARRAVEAESDVVHGREAQGHARGAQGHGV